MENIIEIRNFSFKYAEQDILKSLNLTISKGMCVGILGKNGCGKTTLINCILGELKGRGEIRVLSKIPDIYSVNFKTDIGIILDDDVLIDYLTLNEYLHYVGGMFKISKSDLEDKISYWLNYFDLSNDKDRIVKYFFHGMRKKTQIIAALIHDPKLIIIDEPTNGLDVEMIYALKQILINLKKEGITILLTTHILSFVEDVCDEIIIINDGIIKRKLELDQLDANEKLETIFLNEITNSGDIL